MERERLVARLAGTRGVRVVLLAAPAGYGKTELLRQWERRDARPFTWLPTEVRLEDGVARAASLSGSAHVLVADHRPSAVSDVEDLAAIAAELPPGGLLAVATRDAAGLAYGRLRAQRGLDLLGTPELAMTRGETRAALHAAGVRLPRDGVEALVAAIDGWPAAVSLAAQAIAAAASPAAGARAFGGGDAGVADLVRHEILDALPARRRRLLRRAAVLDVLDPDGCVAVLETPEARTLPGDVARTAVPVQRIAGGVRCHRLVRDVLLAELRAVEPDAEPALHRRASAWLSERDDLDGAVRHAIAAGDLGLAGTLLWREAQADAWSGRAARLRLRLERVPSHAPADAPTLELARALVSFTDLDADGLDHLLGRATGPLSPTAAAGRAVLGAFGADDAPALCAQGARASNAVPRHGALHGLGRLAEGVGALLAGDPRRGAAALDDGRRAGAVAAPGLVALCEAELALLALLGEADRDAARDVVERARARVAAEGLEELPAMALVLAVAALVRATDGRYASAAADVGTAERLLDGARAPAWYAAQVGLATGRARLRFGAIAGARDRLADADRAARRVTGALGLRAWTAAAVADARVVATAALAGSDPLTVAELRVLRLLPTHLGYREIGERFRISANTVKTQAHAVYRKLGVASRSEAVARATALGLVDAGPT